VVLFFFFHFSICGLKSPDANLEIAHCEGTRCMELPLPHPLHMPPFLWTARIVIGTIQPPPPPSLPAPYSKMEDTESARMQ
jgi:hypothetical protein